MFIRIRIHIHIHSIRPAACRLSPVSHAIIGVLFSLVCQKVYRGAVRSGAAQAQARPAYVPLSAAHARRQCNSNATQRIQRSRLASRRWQTGALGNSKKAERAM